MPARKEVSIPLGEVMIAVVDSLKSTGETKEECAERFLAAQLDAEFDRIFRAAKSLETGNKKPGNR